MLSQSQAEFLNSSNQMIVYMAHVSLPNFECGNKDPRFDREKLN